MLLNYFELNKFIKKSYFLTEYTDVIVKLIKIFFFGNKKSLKKNIYKNENCCVRKGFERDYVSFNVRKTA